MSEGTGIDKRYERTRRMSEPNETTNDRKETDIYMCVTWPIPLDMGLGPMTHTKKKDRRDDVKFRITSE